MEMVSKPIADEILYSWRELSAVMFVTPPKSLRIPRIQ